MPAIATVTLNPALDVTTSVDRVAPTHKLRCTAPRRDPGGGGINVARAIHALGGAATAIFASGGPAGAAIESLLRAADVPIVPVPIAGETRESITVDETTSGDQYRFVMPGPALSREEQAEVRRALAGLPSPPGWVVVSGSLPDGAQADLLRTLAADASAAGARLILDTSGPALAQCDGLGAYLVKPSLRELGDVAGAQLADDAAVAAAARALIARGFAQAVLVSLGERGAMLVEREHALRYAAIDVPVVSAVGAGDSMVAAVTLALAGGATLRDAVHDGIAAGAAALLTPATELLREADVARLRGQVAPPKPL